MIRPARRVMLFVAWLIALALAAWLARQVLHPLRRLAEHAERVAAGDVATDAIASARSTAASRATDAPDAPDASGAAGRTAASVRSLSPAAMPPSPIRELERLRIATAS